MQGEKPAPGGANGLLLDEKNGVSISTAAYPVIGEYLPGNLLAGGAGILGPTLLGHQNNGSANSDNAGNCTLAGTPATCTINFAKPWNNPPICIGNDQTNLAPIKIVPPSMSVPVTSEIVTGTMAGDLVGWHCEGNPN